MEPLSPRSANLPLRQVTSKKDKLEAKAATTRKLQRQKDHPPPPPPQIHEPNALNGRRGERYSTGKFLGKGGFAICYEGELQDRQSQPSGHRYALKIVKTVMNQTKMFKTELQIHSKMHHPFIVEFHRAFTFGESTYIVLELCPNGSMMDMVRKRKYLTEPEVRRYVIQMCGAIKYMHHKNVLHRDLKMGNIFLDEHMNIKIGDFGLAALLVSGAEYGNNRRRTLCGTPNYIAPEVLEKGQKGHNFKVDIWSLGIIIFAMLTGFPPFQSNTQEEIYRKVKARDYDWPSIEACANDISPFAQDLVATLLVDAEERPDPDDIASHAFFRAGHVPDALPATARVAPPTMPVWDPKDGGTIEDWWQTQWAKVCRQCGVGRINKRECFDLVGQGLRKSTYKECQLEEKAGRTPIIPMPSNTVYMPFPDAKNWPMLEAVEEEEEEEEEEQDLVKMGRTRTDGINKSNPVPYPSVPNVYPLATASSRDTKIDMMGYDVKEQIQTALSPRYKERKSHAATLREQAQPVKAAATVRPRAVSKSKLAVMTLDGENVPRQKAVPSGLLRDRAVRPASREVPAKAAATVRSSARITRSQSVQGGLNQGTSRASTLPRGGVPKSASSRAILKETSATAHATNAYASRTTRVTHREKEAVETRTAVGVRSLAEDERARSGTARHEVQDKVKEDSAPSRSTVPSHKPQVRQRYVLIDPLESSTTLPNTTPSATQTQTSILLKNLDSALADKPSRTPSNSAKLRDHPIVSRWVDYTNRYGIGYILNDGSIGVIFSSKEDTPSAAVVVRDAEDHVRNRNAVAYSERFQTVPPMENGTVQFYENRTTEGIKCLSVDSKEYRIDLDEMGQPSSLVPGSSEVDDRRRRYLVLWRKFANFMANPNDGYLADSGRSSVGHAVSRGPFVKFYQRFGDVGVWGYDDGVFQINFPDHTKLVISPDGTYAEFCHLPVSAAQHLAHHGELPAGSVERRDVLSYPISSLLRGIQPPPAPISSGTCSPDDISRIVSANHLREKIVFFRDVVAQWCAHGGLGFMDPGKERMEWRGLRERASRNDQGNKSLWVTVGREGGDERDRGTRVVQ
ncbi:MAG: Cell cycle serine/threonine-protein kinase cdc5/MSD2 [Caeruleum heppii]|nr:MAG: Cell cycle serine/threonine-protein kinase cdc5/MSD2 [Caeruleum heppii]